MAAWDFEFSTLIGPVTKQYNLVLAKAVISLAGKVTAGWCLVESNGGLYHRVDD